MTDLNLAKYNRHWEGEFIYPYAKKRDKFQELVENMDKKQIVELVGLRRTGKSVLFFQLINQLIEKEINRFSIWYFTFDDEESDLDKLLESFEKQSGVNFREKKVFVFLDEIQKLENFQAKIKVYYDLYPNIKFFISGSTSLFVRKKTQESLAGRIVSLFLPPLNFIEYLRFKEKENILEKTLAFEREIEKEFEIFLRSQFVESIEMNLDERREYLSSIVRKIVFEDIPQVFPVENTEALWKIVRIISQSPGRIINLQELCQEIDISNKTLSNYLYYLEESFLVKKIYNFSKNLLTSEKRLKKYYLASPSFCWALTDFSENGKLAENVVISLRDYRFFWRDAYGHEVDFVDVKNEKIIPIEVKYRNNLSSNMLNNLEIFLNKFKIKEGVILGKVVKDNIVDVAKGKIRITSVFLNI
jgi:uncharacterized protein